MKKLLSVLIAVAFVLGAAAALADEPTSTTTTPTTTAKPLATAPKPVEKSLDEKASEICKQKGLTGTALEECVKVEKEKLSAEKAKVK